MNEVALGVVAEERAESSKFVGEDERLRTTRTQSERERHSRTREVKG